MFKKNKNFDFHKSKIEVPMINKIKKLSKLKLQDIKRIKHKNIPTYNLFEL